MVLAKLSELSLGKEKCYLTQTVFNGVRTMNRILSFVLCVQLTNRPRRCFGWIGRTNHAPPFGNSILAFKRNRNAWCTRHKFHELIIEWPSLMNLIKGPTRFLG